MPIPIQIINPQKCNNGYNGNLNAWDYLLNEEKKNKMIKEYNTVGQLAQYDTVNSPYYTKVEINPEYIKFMQCIRKNK